MNEPLLEIKEYHGSGYQPLIDFGTWRVAILRWEPGAQNDEAVRMERHTATDEVFILLAGSAILVIGGNQAMADQLNTELMAGGALYNVKQGTWHTTLLSPDASILIVENKDTGPENTEYCDLSPQHKQELQALSL